MSKFVMELHVYLPDTLSDSAKSTAVQLAGMVAEGPIRAVGGQLAARLQGQSAEEEIALESSIAAVLAPHTPADAIGRVRAAWATVDRAMQELSDGLDDLGRLADEIEVSLRSSHDDR